MSLVPPPPAPYTDFANQFQKGRPGVLPTGRFNVPQSNISPPNGGFSIPKQMQSGLNANQYTSQVRLLDVDDNRAGTDVVNDGALSKTPWETLQPYSLICIGGTDDYAFAAARSINPNDRPMKGCVLDYLMDRPNAKAKPYTAFERAVNAKAKVANTDDITLKKTIPLGAGMSVNAMKNMGLFLPNESLTALKQFMEDKDKSADFAIQRNNIAALLDGDKDPLSPKEGLGWFQHFIPDSTVISTTMGDGDKILNELDQASGFGTFGTKIEGHAFVSQCTTQLKCRTMDTVYVVIRAKMESGGGDGANTNFSSPEMCFLTSGQIQKAFREAKGDNDDAKLQALGNVLRKTMTKVERTEMDKYVVLGGWKLGRVVDIHAIPVGNRNAGFIKGNSIYEIMLNIERCTAYELVRHVM